jgi:hypothetical protein
MSPAFLLHTCRAAVVTIVMTILAVAAPMARAQTAAGSTQLIGPYFGGTQILTLQAGPQHAGKLYFLLGTASGTSPGTMLDSVLVPLNVDAYTLHTITYPNQPPLAHTFGFLGGPVGDPPSSIATSSITIPAASSPSLAGITLHHAFIVFDLNLVFQGSGAVLAASNAVLMQIAPGNVTLQDDFNAGSLTATNPWNVVSGGFAVVDQALTATVGSPWSEMVVPIAVAGTNVSFAHTIKGQIGDEFYLGINDTPGLMQISQDKGYFLLTRVDYAAQIGRVYLWRSDGCAVPPAGCETILLEQSLDLLPNTAWTVEAVRDQSGTWRIFLNGQQVGGAVVDMTYTSFSYVHVKSDGHDSFASGTQDDVLVMQ